MKIRIALSLTFLLTTLSFTCANPDEVKWEYVIPDNYEGFLAIRFECPGGQPLVKKGVAHVVFKADGTFCTSDTRKPSSETTWLPDLQRSPHQTASGKPVEKPVETPERGYALCCENITNYCDSTFIVLWVGNMPRNVKIPEDEIKFLHERFELRNCRRPDF
ncbi:MAG TPA: hypothetical protein VJS64_10745 [Pyrinomonadaceae bacterium]|nr:hypothetical protein [Pyrinomonadaceae bacterium]